MSAKPTIVVTGAAGNLGRRLLPHLNGFSVIGVDMRPPESNAGLDKFYELDLGREASCDRLIEILREHFVTAVVHLAFVIDPVMTGVLDKKRMWQINVAGTSRVTEAIAVVNRTGGAVTRFIFPSSVSAYGPDTPVAVREDHPLQAHTLTYAVHKKESDEVVQFRAPSMGDCSTIILRPHIFTGASMQNYLVGALRGTPTGKGSMAASMRTKGKRLPMLLPFGNAYLAKKFQFVHVDDMARLIVFLLNRPVDKGLSIFNVAGRDEALTIARCAEIGETKILRLPGKPLCRLVLKTMWGLKISAVPADALPYIVGSYIMDTSRLKAFLGKDYETVMHFTVEDSLKDCFVQRADKIAATAAQPAN